MIHNLVRKRLTIVAIYECYYKTMLKFAMTEEGMINWVWEGLGNFIMEADIFIILKHDYFPL